MLDSQFNCRPFIFQTSKRQRLTHEAPAESYTSASTSTKSDDVPPVTIEAAVESIEAAVESSKTPVESSKGPEESSKAPAESGEAPVESRISSSISPEPVDVSSLKF